MPQFSPVKVFDRNHDSGFSLVEILVVIFVVGVLAALVVSFLGRARETAHRVTCTSNLRQIMATTLIYVQDHQGMMPLVHKNEAGDRSRWAVQLQDYVSEATPRSTVDDSIFRCPSDDIERTEAVQSTPCSYGLSVYVHINGIASETERRPITIITDPARTIFYGEVWNEADTVFHSLSTGAGETFLGDYHGGEGSHYAFADGHVEFLSKSEVIDNNSELMKGIPLN